MNGQGRADMGSVGLFCTLQVWDAERSGCKSWQPWDHIPVGKGKGESLSKGKGLPN